MMSEVYDSHPNMSDTLRLEFTQMLDHLEKQIKLNIHQVGMETFANSIYYFCKFQHGEKDLWQSLTQNLLKNKDSMTVS